MFKEENHSMLKAENLDEFYEVNNYNIRKIPNYKLNSFNNNNNSNNNSREQFSRDSFKSYNDYDQGLDRFDKAEPNFNNNNNFKQVTPANSNQNSIKNSSPPQKKLINQEDKNNNNFNNNQLNSNRNSINSNNNSSRKLFDSIPGSFEKESLATASDSVSLISGEEQQFNTNEINNNQNKVYKPTSLAFNTVNNTNNKNLNTKNAKVVLKIDENPKKNLKLQFEDKIKEVEKEKPKETKTMKSRNNQSTFAKNPSQSYAEPYYASFPPNARPPKLPVSYFDFTQFSPREVIYPYVVPTMGPIAPYVPAAFPYHSPTGVLSYNLWMRPLILDDKNPSLHDLLYYDNFQRNKDGKSNDVPYATKHIEKKIRAVDGYYNPYGRYTLQDYRNLKANEAFATNSNELDPETKDDKAERMHKRQEAGNLFMKSNPKPVRKPINLQTEQIDAPMPQPQRKQVNLQEPFDLNNSNRNNRHEPEPQYNNRNNMQESLEFNQQYFDLNNMKDYHPSFYNNSMNGFSKSLNNKPEWDDETPENEKEDVKLTQSQKLIQINHPTKKFYKNPKFNFNEKPPEVSVIETRQRAIEYAKRIKD